MAEKAIKYKRSMALEPMNSYERHVIHTALQNYEGVTTSSTGSDEDRRVVIYYDAKTAGNYRGGRGGNRGAKNADAVNNEMNDTVAEEAVNTVETADEE